MRLYFPVDLTGNLIMIEKLVLGEIWTGDLPIFNPDVLTSAPSRQESRIKCREMIPVHGWSADPRKFISGRRFSVTKSGLNENWGNII